MRDAYRDPRKTVTALDYIMVITVRIRFETDKEQINSVLNQL